MIKRLLSLVTVLLAFCFIGNAQVLKRSERSIGLNKVVRPNSLTRASSDGALFSYGITPESYVGAGANHYDCAIFVPGKFAGNSIDVIGFYLVDKSALTNVKCWIAKDLPSNLTTDCMYAADVTSLSDLMTSGLPCLVKTSGVKVPEGGCYVGYSFDVSDLAAEYGQYPIAFDGGIDKEGGAYLKFTGEDWSNMYGQGFGNLLTMVQMSGDNFVGDAASFSKTSFNRVIGAVNGTAKVKATIMGEGVNPVTSLSYTVKDLSTGAVSSEQTVSADGIAFYETGSVVFEIPVGSEYSLSDKEITITKVNGEANAATDNVSMTGSVLVVTREVPRNIVEEEFTATGCPYCTRGYAGMDALHDKYPDRFIGIAVHGDVNYSDPMRITDYNTVMSGIGGFPTALLNRINEVDPYFGSSSGTLLGIVNDVESYMGPAEAEVVVSPVWNENQTVIEVNTNVTFLYNGDTAPYALGYVLLADGLTGTSYNWWQYNGYYGTTGLATEPYLNAWTTRGTIVEGMFQDYYGNSIDACMVQDMVYDHIAIKATSVSKGVSGSIKAPIVADQVQTHTTTFNLSNGVKSKTGDNLLQDKSKLKVVALLFNTKTGEIVNAAQSEIAPYGSTGIENVSNSADNVKEVARYSIDGTQLNAPAKGINIVKMSDGTTRKVLVNE
ncbi:putative uncharacterized protein [Prevotella sp. CAG:1185]|mgnify:FL=1|nr:putative uncharacterized protein [Prevotella sp. CAG:1185]